jgi:hypothetical protein
MIPPEKPDIVYLLKDKTAEEVFEYTTYNVRLVNM